MAEPVLLSKRGDKELWLHSSRTAESASAPASGMTDQFAQEGERLFGLDRRSDSWLLRNLLIRVEFLESRCARLEKERSDGISSGGHGCSTG